MSTDKTNALIVGGGIIGCATAYYLAKAGAQVTLLERGPLCSEASSAAAGILSVSNREGLFLTLAREGLRSLIQAEEELETDFELVQRGSLTLLFDEEALRRQQTFVEQQRQNGVEIEFLDPQAALGKEPDVSPGILGAVYSPIDCSVSPYLATLAFARGARRLGATLRPGVEVVGLKVEGGRVRAAITHEGSIAGDVVVLAAGAWSPILTRTLGLSLPIEPSRGQMLVTEPYPSLCKSVIKDEGRMYVCPTARGNYVIGSMIEIVGFDKQVTPAKLHEFSSEAARLMPSLTSARLLRAWAGLRPQTPDSLPLLGEARGYDGLFLATGHSRTGILLSALTSRIVADLITKGNTDFPAKALMLDRYAGLLAGDDGT